jgi:hypothetical protein
VFDAFAFFNAPLDKSDAKCPLAMAQSLNVFTHVRLLYKSHFNREVHWLLKRYHAKAKRPPF